MKFISICQVTMSKKIKNSGSVWSGDEPNAWKKLAIDVSLENYKNTDDPICLAQIIRCLDFHGFDEAQDILIKYLSDKTRRNKKFTDELLWKNICDMYFRLEQHPKWRGAPHDAMANHLFHNLGNVTNSKNDVTFASSLGKHVEKYR